ncbi:MAG TPA: hypothetical protein VHW23_24295 [Kofleriaceae bacterium]|nr:hypothetical protein [Kofleriaceae bacterium]
MRAADCAIQPAAARGRQIVICSTRTGLGCDPARQGRHLAGVHRADAERISYKVKKDDLRDWLGDSAATLVSRWRAMYHAAGGQ